MAKKFVLLAATAAAAIMPTTPAFAQDGTLPQVASGTGGAGDIVVTARRRQESILKVPVVANVLGVEAIQNAQITDIAGVATKIPGLFVSESVNTIGTLISLRGIGTSALDAGVDQSVSLNIDGQQFSQGLAFKSGLFDLARVEVLKGPQALFFGKNSPAGVMALTTADPSDYFEGIGRISYEFQSREPRIELIASGPVSDTLGLRLAGSWSDAQGFFRNTAGLTARPDLGSPAPRYDRAGGNENFIVRGTAVWKPTDNFRAKLKVNYTHDYSKNPNGLQYLSCPGGTGPSVIGVPFIGGPQNCTLDDKVSIVDLSPATNPGITNGGTPFLRIDQLFGVLDLGYDLNPNVSIDSTTTYYRNKTQGMIQGTYAGAAAAIWADNNFSRHDFTQEIRIQSDYKNSPLNWMIGGFYQSARMQNDIVIGWNQALNPFIIPIFGYGLPPILDAGTHDVGIDSKSLFGQLRWKPAEVLEIAAGVRWTKEDRSNQPTRFGFAVPIPRPNISSSNWSPELTITYTPTDDLTIFGALKQGYKSGSYQITTPNPANEDRSFGDEKVQGGEVGVKARLANRSLTINAAFYYYRYGGLQIGVSQPAATTGVPITLTKNAGSAQTYGIDFDSTYRPESMDGLAFNLAVNWNKAKFLELNGLPCYGGQTIAAGCNQILNPATGLFTARSESGTPLERAPEWQIIGGVDYETPLSESLGIGLGASAQYSSSWTSPIGTRDDFIQPGFTKLNAYVTLKGKEDRWELSLIGNNLTNVIRCGYCTNSDFKNTTVLTALANTTGGVSNAGPLNPAGKIDDVAGIALPGRQVFVRLTLRTGGRH
ncbi:MAG: TonB-dependent receptor [Novosphingobium sp.]|nr:TonB-dependent receptor [Novosphingobium sp.]